MDRSFAARCRVGWSLLVSGESAQGLVEYVLVIAIVSLGAIVGLGFLDGKVNTLFSNAGNSINNVAVAAGTADGNNPPAGGSSSPPGSPPADAAPSARLAVAPSSGTAPLSVTADASASVDTDTTPIAGYAFNFGDGSQPISTTAPSATAGHQYASAGQFTVTVTVSDTAGKTSTASATVNVSGTPYSVYAGYYDTHHPDFPQPKPIPWRGSPNVLFVGTPDPGTSADWDSSAIRIANLSGATLTNVVVTVDIGSAHFALWGTHSIAVGQSLILAQTAFENFDGSDTNPSGCYGCDAALCAALVQDTVPVVHVTINGQTASLPDRLQILNTHGVDSAGCPDTGSVTARRDESEDWQQLG